MASKFLLLAISTLSLSSFTFASTEYDPPTETTFYSDPFVLAPGEVMRDWYPIKFPKGHLGIRSFNAELVDENHNPVPLNEAYLHHWTVRPFLASDDVSDWDSPGNALLRNGVRGAPHGRAHTSAVHEGGDGLLGEDEQAACESGMLKDIGVWFGVGSETRHTNTSFPAPYAAEIGNPDTDEVVWKAQIHAIDTRHAVDPWGCLECLCTLYDHNGIDGYGNPLKEGYLGGYGCCYMGKICKQKDEVKDLPVVKKTRYLKYTIQYVKWTPCIIPVRIYFMDVASCTGEYDVAPCVAHSTVGSCVDKVATQMTFPLEGEMVFAEGHLHYGGIGINIVRESGDVICDSVPIFGRGGLDEVGNEAGYVTGMGTCEFPNHEVPIGGDEKVAVEAVYSKLGGHTGVMGQFVVGIAVYADYKAPPEGMCIGPGKKIVTAASSKSLVTVSFQTLAVLSAGPTIAVLAVGLGIIAVMYRKYTSADGEFVRLSSTA